MRGTTAGGTSSLLVGRARQRIFAESIAAAFRRMNQSSFVSSLDPAGRLVNLNDDGLVLSVSLHGLVPLDGGYS